MRLSILQAFKDTDTNGSGTVEQVRSALLKCLLCSCSRFTIAGSRTFVCPLMCHGQPDVQTKHKTLSPEHLVCSIQEELNALFKKLQIDLKDGVNDPLVIFQHIDEDDSGHITEGLKGLSSLMWCA
jgi:hypothetical protein